MMTGGLPERYQTAVWKVSSTMRVVPSYHATAATVQLTSACSSSVFSAGCRGPFNAGRPVRRGDRGGEGGVQAQSGDEGNGFTKGLAAVEEVQHGVAVVPHQHNRAMGQPAARERDHLPCPVRDLLVPASLLLVVAGRGRQHREDWQCPMASRPGHLAQSHQ